MASQSLIPEYKSSSSYRRSQESSGLVGYAGYGGVYVDDRQAYQCVNQTTPNTNKFMTAGYELDSGGNYSPIGANTIREGAIPQISMAFHTNTLGIIAQSGYLVFDIGLKHPTLDGYLYDVILWGIGSKAFYGPDGQASGLLPGITRHSVPMNFNYSNTQAMYYNQTTPIIEFRFRQPSGIGLGMDSWPYIDKETTGINLYTARLIVFGESPIYDTSSLFMQCPEPISSGNSLYMSGPLPYSGKNTLYLGGQYPSGITDLYIQGPLPSDNLPSGTSLFIEGYEQTETGLPLFIQGHENYYSGCDLYLEAGKIHDTIPLFLDGLEPVSINNNMNLVMWADGSNGFGNTSKYTTLFMESRDKLNSGIPLFIEGGNFGTKSGSVPLYVNTDGTDEKSTTLVAFNQQSTAFSQTTLFTNSTFKHSGNATLFLDAPNSGEQKNSVPFYINNDQFRTDDVWLTVYNDTSYTESGKTLFLANFVPYNNNIPLFMGVTASGEHNSDIPFYMNNNQFKSSGTPLLLYNELYEPDGVNIPLFMSNFATYSGSVPLFMGVIASGDHNSSIPLHTTCGGYKDKNADLYISNYQLSQSGRTSLFTTSFWSSNGNAPLFIEGPSSGDILKIAPLYVKTTEVSYYDTVSGRRPLSMTVWNNQKDGSNIIDLYIGRSTTDSANTPLVIAGGGIDDRTNFADLYLHSRVDSSGGIPFTLLNGVGIKSIPLVMAGFDPAKHNSGTPLFTYSADNSGIFSGSELFLKSDVFANTIPLFMNVVEVGYPISNIPLYINNDNEHKMSMSVFLESVRWTSGTQNLFINGLGLQPGAEVGRENISMFLARDVDSTSYSMYMHLAAPSGESQVIPMTLEGGTYSQLETTLFLPEAMGNEGSGMNIFTHGI